MGEAFEFRDLSEAEFWGVDLRRATFRDIDFTGARISHARLVDVSIDGEIDRLVVNGVDVTQFVNERDVWFDLRSQVRATDLEHMRAGWNKFTAAWEAAIGRVQRLPPGHHAVSVGGEWSFVQTLRHLVMATDKWFTVPVLGGSFHPIGLANTGSADVPFPGLDVTADPSFDEAIAAWRDRAERLRAYLADAEPAALSVDVIVIENGSESTFDCVGVVFEEHFEHLRYALRDLDLLGQTGDESHDDLSGERGGDEVANRDIAG